MLKLRTHRCQAASWSAVLLLLFAVGASADETPEGASPKTTSELAYQDTDCADEVQLLCSKFGTDERPTFECLSFWKKQGGLSDQCVAFVDSVYAAKKKKVADRRSEYMNACADEIEQHCSEFKSKQLALIGCLDRNTAELSDTCNAKRPRRHRYKGEGNVRWRDGSETAEYNRQLAEKQRKRQERLRGVRLDANGRVVTSDRDRQAQQLLNAHRQRMKQKEKEAAEAGAAEPTTEGSEAAE